jgi:lysophospholipase L1-like esterase
MSHNSARPTSLRVAGAVGLVLLAALVGVGLVAVSRDPKVPAAGQAIGYTPAVEKPVALWIGDSYPDGTGATRATGEAALTATGLGWQYVLDAEGFTGFVNDGHSDAKTNQPVPARLAADKANHPEVSVVVIDAGRNDGNGLTTVQHLHSVVTAYFAAVQKDYPATPVIVIAPYFMTSLPGDDADFRKWESGQATGRHWSFIDPLGEGWIGDASAKLVAPDNIHPTPDGHKYIASHLTADIKKLNLSVTATS